MEQNSGMKRGASDYQNPNSKRQKADEEIDNGRSERERSEEDDARLQDQEEQAMKEEEEAELQEEQNRENEIIKQIREVWKRPDSSFALKHAILCTNIDKASAYVRLNYTVNFIGDVINPSSHSGDYDQFKECRLPEPMTIADLLMPYSPESAIHSKFQTTFEDKHRKSPPNTNTMGTASYIASKINKYLELNEHAVFKELKKSQGATVSDDEIWKMIRKGKIMQDYLLMRKFCFRVHCCCPRTWSKERVHKEVKKQIYGMKFVTKMEAAIKECCTELLSTHWPEYAKRQAANQRIRAAQDQIELPEATAPAAAARATATDQQPTAGETAPTPEATAPAATATVTAAPIAAAVEEKKDNEEEKVDDEKVHESDSFISATSGSGTIQSESSSNDSEAINTLDEEDKELVNNESKKRKAGEQTAVIDSHIIVGGIRQGTRKRTQRLPATESEMEDDFSQSEDEQVAGTGANADDDDDAYQGTEQESNTSTGEEDGLNIPPYSSFQIEKKDVIYHLCKFQTTLTLPCFVDGLGIPDSLDIKGMLVPPHPITRDDIKGVWYLPPSKEFVKEKKEMIMLQNVALEYIKNDLEIFAISSIWKELVNLKILDAPTNAENRKQYYLACFISLFLSSAKCKVLLFLNDMKEQGLLSVDAICKNEKKLASILGRCGYDSESRRAKKILQACCALRDKHNSVVPTDVETLKSFKVSDNTAKLFCWEVLGMQTEAAIDSRGNEMSIVLGLLNLSEFLDEKKEFQDKALTPERINRSLSTWLPETDRIQFNRIQGSWAHLVSSPLLKHQNQKIKEVIEKRFNKEDSEKLLDLLENTKEFYKGKMAYKVKVSGAVDVAKETKLQLKQSYLAAVKQPLLDEIKQVFECDSYSDENLYVFMKSDLELVLDYLQENRKALNPQVLEKAISRVLVLLGYSLWENLFHAWPVFAHVLVENDRVYAYVRVIYGKGTLPVDPDMAISILKNPEQNHSEKRKDLLKQWATMTEKQWATMTDKPASARDLPEQEESQNEGLPSTPADSRSRLASALPYEARDISSLIVDDALLEADLGGVLDYMQENSNDLDYNVWLAVIAAILRYLAPTPTDRLEALAELYPVWPIFAMFMLHNEVYKFVGQVYGKDAAEDQQRKAKSFLDQIQGPPDDNYVAELRKRFLKKFERAKDSGKQAEAPKQEESQKKPKAACQEEARKEEAARKDNSEE